MGTTGQWLSKHQRHAFNRLFGLQYRPSPHTMTKAGASHHSFILSELSTTLTLEKAISPLAHIGDI